MPTQHSELPVLFVSGKPISYITRDRSWTNTVNYWTVRKDKSALPINTYSDTKINRYQSLGREIVTRKSDGVVLSDLRIGYATTAALTARHNELSSWIAAAEPTDAQLENECAIKVLGKLADLKVNLPVTVAEMGKTIDLILGKAHQLWLAYGDVRHGRLRDALKTLGIPIHYKRELGVYRPGYKPLSKSAAKQWLEIKYGWMPLLMDVKGAAEAIVDRLHGGRLPWIVASAKVTSQKSLTNKFVSGYSTGSYGVEAASAAKTYKIKIWADLSNPHLNQAQQLGLTNPALVAWELVPFSFVFDWFMSVGNYLEAASALQGITVRRAFISRVREVNTSYYSHAHPYETATNRSTGYEFNFGSYGRSYTRSPYVVNPLLLYPPVNRDPLNIQRLITGLALLQGNARNFRV